MLLSCCVVVAHLGVSLLQSHSTSSSNHSVDATTVPVTSGANSLVTPMTIGAVAPDFEFRSSDFGWRRLSDVLDQGNVLLVFGDSDDQLRSLESSRARLAGAGIVPMFVTSMTREATWNAVVRCDVTYSVLSDPSRDVATKFCTANDPAARAFIGWVLIDARGRVRGFGGQQTATPNWAAVANTALDGGGSQTFVQD